jgi:hypothetical protein
LRHDAHPLIQFLDGPSGRRASLIGRGLDVWEVSTSAAVRLARGQTHAGLILLPSKQARSRAVIDRLVDVVETVIKNHPDGLESSERWIAPLSSC